MAWTRPRWDDPTSALAGIRSRHVKKVACLVPLALISAGWTLSTVSVGYGVASVDVAPARLPGGGSVPSRPIEVPASVSQGEAPLLGVGARSVSYVVDTASTSDIPAAALAAYQRAETVIDKAAPNCHLPWQLLAAIGRVESDHGRAQGNVLGDDGIVTPGIFGPQLDGTNNTQAIADTDGGAYDGDTTADRAVGPMQFIPSTWSTVGVDADQDGKRNPQDINDAALAAAVYLCSGNEDLATQAGKESAVGRYNHDATYVDEVLAIEQAYETGDYTAVPNFTVPSSYFVPDPVTTPVRVPGEVRKHKPHAQATLPPAPKASASAPAPTQSAAPQTPQQPKASDKPKSSNPLPSGVPSVSLPSTGITPLDQGLSQVNTLANCLTGSLGSTITNLIPNAASLSQSTLIADLQKIPVVGAGLVTQLTGCLSK